MNIYHIVLSKYRLIIAWGLVFALVAVLLTLFLPKQYSANAQLLIISRDRTGVDPYTQAKSAERIAENLSQIINTSDFYSKVVSSSYNFDRDVWGKLTERSRRKKWDNDVLASVMYGTGIMNINTYANSKTEAVNLSNAIASTLASHGWEYLGGDVVIKVVSQPLEPRFPSRPNFAVNIIVGFLIGVLLSASWQVRYKKHYLIS